MTTTMTTTGATAGMPLELIGVLIAATVLLLTMLSIAYAGGRKLGQICTRINLIDRWQIQAITEFNKISERLKAIEDLLQHLTNGRT